MATALAILNDFRALDDGGGNALVAVIDAINGAPANQLIRNISVVKDALDRMYVRGRGAMSHEEVLAKYNAAQGNVMTMTPDELVRLFSPPNPLFNNVRDDAGLTAFVTGLEADSGNAGEVIAKRAIVKSINDHLQTAMPEIIFSTCDRDGDTDDAITQFDLTYGPATVVLGSPGITTKFHVYGKDATTLGVTDGAIHTVSKGWKFNQTGQFEQTPPNCLRLEHLTLLPDTRLASPASTGAAIPFLGVNGFKNTCVCLAFSTPTNTQPVFACPIDTKYVKLPPGVQIYIRYPDRAVIYVTDGGRVGTVDFPPGTKIKLRVSNNATFLRRNYYNTFMGQKFRGLSGCNVLNNPGMLPNVALANTCARKNVAGTTYGCIARAAIVSAPPLTLPLAAVNANAAFIQLNNGNTLYQIGIGIMNPGNDTHKAALKALARVFMWEFVNEQYVTTDAYEPIYGGGKKNITNKKYRNVNKRQRRSKSKSKSMSMFKSAKRVYRMNKRNKTSKKY